MLPSGNHKHEMLTVLSRVLDDIGDRPFDAELEARLNRLFGSGGETFKSLTRLLKLGVEEGWAGYEPVGGADYRRGRIANPSNETAGMSVESGVLRNVKGEYHCHTRGEINMIIPIDRSAQFSGHGIGWMVFPPLSEHFPTVTGGKALMMYFLPNGEIEYKTPPTT
jgi:Domain of unknown function (DUF4863)